jgi:hypothetical protein
MAADPGIVKTGLLSISVLHFTVFSKKKHWGTFIIKLIMAVIYGFRCKLDCLSLNTRLGWKACQGQTLKLITETVNYGHNKFYDTASNDCKRFINSCFCERKPRIIILNKNIYKHGMIMSFMASNL